MIIPFFFVTTQQGVPGDGVPWPEREVSSPFSPSLDPPPAGPERELNSHLSSFGFNKSLANYIVNNI